MPQRELNLPVVKFSQLYPDKLSLFFLIYIANLNFTLRTKMY